MAKKKKRSAAKQKSAGAARPARTGMDRFAVPAAEPPAAQRQPAARQAAPAQTGKQPASAAPRAQTAGMQVRVGDPAQRLRPQRTQPAVRSAAAARARSERLRRIVRRKDRRARLVKVFAALLSVACSLFALTAFFEIREIGFRGLSHYKADQVLETFGVTVGDNLFLCDSWRGAHRLEAAYPYFLDVRITRELPSKLIINITEAKPAAVVNGRQGGWYIMDQTGRVLEKTDEQSAKEVAEVLGLDTVGSAPGTALQVEQEPEKLEDLKTLLAALDRAELLDEVTMYNVTKRERIWFQYSDRFAVCVGSADELDDKLAMLRQLLEEELFSPSDKGTIDLSQTGRAVTDMSLTAAQVRAAVRGQSALARSVQTADADGVQAQAGTAGDTDG